MCDAASVSVEVQTLVLPLSGWIFQWRSDDHWRELDADQYRAEQDGTHVPGEDEWVAWTGTLHRLARGGWGQRPRWQLIYSELTDGRQPHVVVADGTEPPIMTFGGLWLCEWIGVPQPATVTVGPERWVVPLGRRPDYLPDDDEPA